MAENESGKRVVARMPVCIAAAAAVVALLVTLGTLRREQAAVTAAGGIANIDTFLQQCPTNDVKYSQIRSDFEIRKEGSVVGAIPCSEPISAMPVAKYTDELIAVQALRTIYYMEGGRSVPYPWTSGSFYEWMKSKIGGIDIRANGSYCCEIFNGKWFVVISSQGEFGRNADRKWTGLSARIALLGHETRHVDGFPHVGGCPLFPTATFGCDETYDEGNLSPYGIQWWLNAKWLSGELNVGYSCLSENDVADIANGHLYADNNDYGRRFAGNAPPVLTMPEQPGGACAGASPTSTQTAAPTPSKTPSPTSSKTPSPTPSKTPSPTPTASPAPTPTATASVTATPAPTATPPGLIQGDVDCSRAIDSVDALKALRFAAQLSVLQNEPCPEVGTGAAPVWGDMDCSGGVSSADALKTLRHLAGLPVSQTEPCPDIGSALPPV